MKIFNDYLEAARTDKRLEEIFKIAKNSLEDAQSQRVTITKRFINNTVMELSRNDNIRYERLKNVVESLAHLFDIG